MIDWVQCDVYEEWLHKFYIGIEASFQKYICILCVLKETACQK